MVSLLVLSVPSLLTMLAGAALFQLVDLRFLSQLGPDAVAAAGATNQTLRQFFLLPIMGTSVASQMLIARFIGERSLHRAEHIAGQTFVIGAAISALAAAVGVLLAEPLISLVIRDPEVIALATVYLQISFALLFTLALVNLGSTILAGAGDATTPMVVSLLITPVSIAAEWVLAFGKFGFPALGIAGIALGAGIGGLWGTCILLWALLSGRCRVHLRLHHLLPDPRGLRRLLSYSWQPAIHMLARGVLVFFYMWVAGLLGGKVQAAYTIGLRLEMPLLGIAMTLGNACATLVGQNLGASDRARSWRAIWVSLGAEVSLLWPGAAALFFYRHELVALFAQDPEVMAIASEFLAYSAATLVVYAFYFVSFRALQAAGEMNAPMVISFGNVVLLATPLSYYLAIETGLGAAGIWIGYLTYVVVNTAMTTAYLLSGRWARILRSRPAA